WPRPRKSARRWSVRLPLAPPPKTRLNVKLPLAPPLNTRLNARLPLAPPPKTRLNVRSPLAPPPKTRLNARPPLALPLKRRWSDSGASSRPSVAAHHRVPEREAVGQNAPDNRNNDAGFRLARSQWGCRTASWTEPAPLLSRCP